jgi:phosphatidylglycerophosphate synthase
VVDPRNRRRRRGRIAWRVASFLGMEPNHGGAAAVAALGTSPRDSVRATTDPSWPRGRARTVQAAAAIGPLAQLPVIAAILGVVSLSGPGLTVSGWIVGITCGVITNIGLARGLGHFHTDRLAPADWVTLARATVAAIVAALVADSFQRSPGVPMLLSFTAVALALDAVDGWVARRTKPGSLGAAFDAEVDAFLILVLSVYVARSLGAWVLLIGAARYVFLTAGWALPWLREPLPPRYWRKFVAATQGIVLAVAAANVLPQAVSVGALLGALVLLAESFGRDVWWLRINRKAIQRRPASKNGATPAVPQGVPPERGRLRAGMAPALTILALLFVWAALVGPDQPIQFRPSAFLRLPLEGFILIAAAALLPRRARRILVWVVGPLIGLVILLKILNIGFFAAFDRPFDPYQDASYTGVGVETLYASLGSGEANLILGIVALLVIVLPTLATLSLRRLTRIAAEHRIWSLRVVAGLGGVWLLCWALGAQFLSHTPIASTSTASLLIGEVNQFQADLQDHAVFAKEISHDRFAATPGDQLLTGLRGKDVLLVFVESYGKVAVQGSSFAPGIDAVLARGTRQLQAAGFSERSAFVAAPNFGGISWLAHSTTQAGVWVNSPRRYDQLIASHRFTLSDAFNRAGWRTVYDAPANDRAWPPGKSFYHFDKLYNRYDVGYHGPKYAYAPMPDQYVLAALQRLELAKRHRQPLFAQVNLVSSHTPWTRIPPMIPWSEVGNGSIFNRLPTEHTGDDSLSFAGEWSWLDIHGSSVIQKAYSQTIRYTMNALVAFLAHYRDPNLVVVALGDEQPWTIVSGDDPSHDVPISIIARDPAVLKRIAGWGWSNGLRPSPRAPVWPESAFRDRFLTTFGSHPATGSPQ